MSKSSLALALAISVMAGTVAADYSLNDAKGKSFQVFDESVRKDGDAVVYYVRITDQNHQSAVFQFRYVCATKYYQSRDTENKNWGVPEWSPTDSVARAMGDYACQYAVGKNTQAPPVSQGPVNPPIGQNSGAMSGEAWLSDFGNDTIGVLTYKPCESKLKDLGFEYVAGSSIPVTRLKNINDAFSVYEARAVTVQGCWSPKMKKAVFHRKKGDKIWSIDIDLTNGSWVPVR